MQEKESIMTDKSVPRITVWHHTAEPRDAKTVTLGIDLFVRTSHSCQILIVIAQKLDGLKRLRLWTQTENLN